MYLLYTPEYCIPATWYMLYTWYILVYQVPRYYIVRGVFEYSYVAGRPAELLIVVALECC